MHMIFRSAVPLETVKDGRDACPEIATSARCGCLGVPRSVRHRAAALKPMQASLCREQSWDQSHDSGDSQSSSRAVKLSGQ